MEVIRILNMEEYNPRKDRKKHSWFRVDNTIGWSKKLHGLDGDQRWFWIFLLSQASFAQTDCVEFDLSYLAEQSKVPEEKILTAIEHFKKPRGPKMEPMIEVLTYDGNQVVTSSGNQSESDGITTDGQTDGHNITDGQTENPPPPPAVEPEPEQETQFPGVLKELQDEILNTQLAHVSLDVQRSWLHEFPDPTWIKRVLRKCFAKRKSKKLSTPSDKIASICTDWLYKEDNPPARYKSAATTSESPPDPRGKQRLDELLNEHSLKTLNKIRGGGISHAG